MWTVTIYGRTFTGPTPEAVIAAVERYERTCTHRLVSLVPTPVTK